MRDGKLQHVNILLHEERNSRNMMPFVAHRKYELPGQGRRASILW